MELRAVQACLRAGIEARATTVGPFLALLNTETDNPFLNYAVPVDGAAPTADDVASLIDFFTGRDRLPGWSTSDRRPPWTNHCATPGSTSPPR